MKNIFKFSFIALVFATVTSCNDYLDVNENLNSPTLAQSTPDTSLSGAQAETIRPLVRRMNTLGNVFMQQWGGNVVSIGDPFGSEIRYQMSSSFYDDVWNTVYRRTSDLTNIIEFNNEKDWSNYKAIAYILRSYHLQYMVDLYGDVPYTEMHMRSENLTPSYDNSLSVYQNLNEDVDKALALIAAAPATTETVGNRDGVFGGSMAEWTKFANTLKLRLAIRGRSSSNATASTYFNNVIANLNTSGAAFIDANVMYNPGYTNDAAAKQNPFYNANGFTTSGAQTGNRNVIVATKYIIDYMDGNQGAGDGNTTYPVDSRLQRLFSPATGGTDPDGYFGIEQGQLFADVPSGQKLNLLGPGLINTDPAIGSASDAYFFTLAESKFLQAEAQEAGILAGTARDSFEDGVNASFATLGATPGGYLASAHAIDGLGWDATTNKLEAIMTQKWLALGGINGIETWIEHSRTGFPNVPLPFTATDAAMPVKLLYPESEVTGNTTNVPSQDRNTAFSSVTAAFWAN